MFACVKLAPVHHFRAVVHAFGNKSPNDRIHDDEGKRRKKNGRLCAVRILVEFPGFSCVTDCPSKPWEQPPLKGQEPWCILLLSVYRIRSHWKQSFTVPALVCSQHLNNCSILCRWVKILFEYLSLVAAGAWYISTDIPGII